MYEAQKNLQTFTGIFIPAELIADHRFSWPEKVLLQSINALDNGSGCFASNGYFAKLLDLSSSRVSELIGHLVREKVVKLELSRKMLRGKISTERKLFCRVRYSGGKITPAPPLRNSEAPPSENRRTPSEFRITPSENRECIKSSYSDNDKEAGAAILHEKAASADLGPVNPGGKNRADWEAFERKNPGSNFLEKFIGSAGQLKATARGQ